MSGRRAPGLSPGVAHHALAGVGIGDVGELALERGGDRPAVLPFHLDGSGGERGVGGFRGQHNP